MVDAEYGVVHAVSE
jgi:hypothetical protein